jgi:putative transposase
MTNHGRRSYDHRIKAQVILSGNPDLFSDLEIPRSTALSWIRRGMSNVATLDEATEIEAALRTRVAELEYRIAMLTGVLRLVLAVVRVLGSRLELARLPDAGSKRNILNAVERARKVMPLSSALRVLRLSSARYHAWKQASEVCRLDDRPSCPRSVPQRLTYDEVEAMGDMVQSKEHRHMPIRALALYAQRVGRVVAHPATWSKLIRERGWRRPRLRVCRKPLTDRLSA